MTIQDHKDDALTIPHVSTLFTLFVEFLLKFERTHSCAHQASVDRCFSQTVLALAARFARSCSSHASHIIVPSPPKPL